MMEPLVQRSAQGGTLVEVEVPAAVTAVPNPENEVDAAAGVARTMFVYVPATGCPHPKQAAVLYVLRDGADRASAQAVLDDLGVAELAEREHVIVVLPNPAEGGWNAGADAARDDDAAFLVRCFAVLKGAVGVSGFNGMMYYLATSPASSAMAWTLATTRPLDAAAVMIGSFPKGYEPPAGAGAEQVAWLYERNPVVEAYLAQANGVEDAAASGELPEAAGVVRHVQQANPCVSYYVSEHGLSADEVVCAWHAMFSGARRWRNDVHGIYQPRIDFEGRGFTAHIDDTSLGLADGLPRTWYEYVPERLRGTDEPVPLVLYFHGINCMGLYGAEQSGWADIADRDGLCVVFPDATKEMIWNAWDDKRIPSDMSYILALIEHMNRVHPIDYQRVYLSGFSMGSMFANSLAGAYPELFAGVVACNAPHISYFRNLDECTSFILSFNPNSSIRSLKKTGEECSPASRKADEKIRIGSWRVPIVQFAGLADGVGFDRGHMFPARDDGCNMWGPTLTYWKTFNNIPVEPLYADTETGFAADACAVEGADGRFIHQSWASADEGAPELYHLVAVKRMPHAVDLREIEIGWQIVKHWSRNADGSLSYTE